MTSTVLRTRVEAGAERALRLFHRAASAVPAYADFLAERGVDPAAVRTRDEFAALPVVTKANYLQRYPVDRLVWHGDLTAAGVWSTSSGSTGSPSYWPRGRTAVEESVELHSRIFRRSFGSQYATTLVVVGFAMGNWIGGTYTYAALTALANRGHRISVVAPGIDVDAIVDNIARLGPHYDRIVLAGYPPFVKDVVDRANGAVLRHDLRVLLAGEAISERWRDHVLARIGKPGRPQDTCLIYGTADAGMIGHETPATVAVRRAADRDPALCAAVLGGTGPLPTFVEYDPDLRYVETDADERLLFTVDSAIPLIRYRINDVGSVLTATDLTARLRTHGHDLPVHPSTESTAFLALRHRTDIAATFYGLGIYPDHVKAGLEDRRIADAVTGKFVMSTYTDRRFEQSLALRVELRDGVRGGDVSEHLVRSIVVEGLARTNSEYRRLHQSLGHRAEPQVSLHRFGSDGFRTGIKHAWTNA